MCVNECVYICVKVVAGLCHSVVYGLLCFVLDQFHADTLGSDDQVWTAAVCFSECLLSLLLWVTCY